MMARKCQKRRGVLLLVVLSLLVMFVLIGTTFMIVADQYNQSSKVVARKASKRVDPDSQLESALKQLLRGSVDPASPLARHSLLDDLYGNDGFTGRFISSPAFVTVPTGDLFTVLFNPEPQTFPLEVGRRIWPGYFVQFDEENDTSSNPAKNWRMQALGLNQNQPLDVAAFNSIQNYFVRYNTDISRTTLKGKDFYAGSIITALNGAAAGSSFRIVRFNPPATNPTRPDSPYVPDPANPLVPLASSPPGTAPGSFLLENLDGVDVRLIQPGDRFLVNGRQFSGSGFGYDPSEKENTTQAREMARDFELRFTDNSFLPEIALMPNYSFAADDEFLTNNVPPPYHKYQLEFPFRHDEGGMDEAWDAVDFQNMFMGEAPVAPDPTILTAVGTPNYNNHLLDMIGIPSFHRPFLVNNWVHRLAEWGSSDTAALDYWYLDANPLAQPNNGRFTNFPPQLSKQYPAQFRRNIIMRPMPDQHPLFDGGNAAFSANFDQDNDGIPDSIDPDVYDNASWDPTTLRYGTVSTTGGDGQLDNNYNGVLAMPAVSGPWDVDNDNDGLAESIWLDLGMPIESTADGRLYKPLFAIHCVDLDGRLNLNAHGNRNHLEPALPPQEIPVPLLPRGQAYGPADVNLVPVLGGPTFLTLLNDRQYGQTNVSSINVEPHPLQNIKGPAPGLATATPSVLNEFQNYLSESGVPLSYSEQWNNVQAGVNVPVGRRGSNFSSPNNLQGLGFLNFNPLLAPLGQPFYSYMGVAGDPINDPYEINLRSRSPNDRLFDVGELESLYRRRDYAFSSISGRLTNYNIPIGLEGLFTTRQSHIPVPDGPQFISATDNQRNADDGNAKDPKSIVQMFDAAMDEEIATSGTVPEYVRDVIIDLTDPNYITSRRNREMWKRMQIFRMLPADLRNGGRLDVNRAIGNGLDDDNDAVVDDPDEPIWLVTNGVDDDGDGTTDELDEALEPILTEAFGTNVRGQFRILDYFADGNPTPTGTQLYNEFPMLDYTGNGGNSFWVPIIGRLRQNPPPGEPRFVDAPSASRQLLARHLYCTAMVLLRDYDIDPQKFGVPNNATNADEYKAQKLAQWAINVVDFRDPDSINTPFEFDINPFDGWDVDGILHNVLDGGVAAVDEKGFDNNRQPYRGLVWGVEQPELVMTETLALHNTRTRDLSTEDTGGAGPGATVMNGDQDFDQFRKPEGSLFIELFCPRQASNHTANQLPNELYYKVNRTDNVTQHYLYLGQIRNDGTAANNLGGANAIPYPVWRIVLSRQTTLVAAALGAKDRRARFLGEQPRPNRNDIPTFDQFHQDNRFIWFSSANGADQTRLNPNLPTYFQDRVYWNRSQFNLPDRPGGIIQTGGYALIAPRLVTEISSYDNPMTGARATTGSQLIRLQDFHRNFNNPFTAVVHQYRTWLEQQTAGDGSNIYVEHDSEIADPTTVPMSAASAQTYIKTVQGYASPLIVAANVDSYPQRAVDSVPGEAAAGISVSEERPSSYYTHPNPLDPDGDDQLMEDDPAYLPLDAYRDPADPLTERALDVPYHPELPEQKYPVYAVAYLQRLADPTRGWNPNPVTAGPDFHDPTKPVNPYITVDWHPIDLNVYNGESNANYTPTPIEFTSTERKDPTLWRTSTFQNSLGRYKNVLNDNSEVAPTSVPPTQVDNMPSVLRTGLGRLAETQKANPVRMLNLNNTAGILRENYPNLPFPWITWNNRPFISQFELMQVPSTSSDRLFYDFSTANGDPFDDQNPDDPSVFEAPYQHLLNFFHSFDDETPAENIASLMDILEVPSRFTGSQKYLDPFRFQASQTSLSILRDLKTPLNKISRYQDPGRINVNTIRDPRVWDALGMVGTTWNQVRSSRFGGGLSLESGYGFMASNNIATTEMYNVPSRYNNPFRSASAAKMMPSGIDRDHPLDATLLRRSPTSAQQPLFANNAQNTYLYYHDMQRLGSLTTTHSNVFAVWITVGYFEVLPWNPSNPYDRTLPPVPDAAHPDGYQLGQELGSDSGDAKRHRAFYIIDRSIPVGFERGKDHNVDNAILLRRFIE